MAEHRIEVHPKNPGQFFACCGLLELATLIDPGALGGFEGDGSQFAIQTDGPLQLELQLAPRTGAAADPEPGLERLTLVSSGGMIDLDWWYDDARGQKSALKAWGGRQMPRDSLNELLKYCDMAVPFADLFQFSEFLSTRFGVDPRSAWDALDLGYSANDIRQKAKTYPWVEALAVVGLQGFRPNVFKRRAKYAAWLAPLPLTVARAAAVAPWEGLPVKRFEFEIATRGQGYKTFMFAKGENNDRSNRAIRLVAAG